MPNNMTRKVLNINKIYLLHRLRVRIKALQQTIDTQSVRIADLISSQVLASMNGMENDTVYLFIGVISVTTKDNVTEI